MVFFTRPQDDIMPIVDKLNSFVVRRAGWLALVVIAYSNGGTLAALESLLRVTGLNARAERLSPRHTARVPAA